MMSIKQRFSLNVVELTKLQEAARAVCCSNLSRKQVRNIKTNVNECSVVANIV